LATNIHSEQIKRVRLNFQIVGTRFLQLIPKSRKAGIRYFTTHVMSETPT